MNYRKRIKIAPESTLILAIGALVPLLGKRPINRLA